MKIKVEKIYSNLMKTLMYGINPIKKLIIKTYCTVHKYINIEAIELLKQNNYCDEYEFYKGNIKALNDGVVWADQNFKSTNHFYNVDKFKGLYGFSNALEECKKYYMNACRCYREGDTYNSLFYLGSACHLLQDTTVPQHINNKLLKGHRTFELWILKKVLSDYSFKAKGDIIQYDNIEDYINSNAHLAKETYENNVYIHNKEERYKNIAEIIILQAEKTTAGLMTKFYKEVEK